MILQQCDCLSAVGMSVECLDSYCPSHHKCDHVIKPSCWDTRTPTTERDKVLDTGIALIQKRIDGIFEAYKGEINEKLTARPYSVADGMDEAIKMLKSLRNSLHPNHPSAHKIRRQP